MATSVIINVKLNYLPVELSQSPNCCQNILVTTLVNGDIDFLSTSTEYVLGSSHVFAITV